MNSKFGKCFSLILVLFLAVALLNGCGGKKVSGPPELKTASVVESTYVTTAPTIDGVSDDSVWQNITPVNVVLDNINNFDMKTVYDDSNIYFVFEWFDNDEGEMSTVGEWVKENGNWNWHMITDAFSVMWDISGVNEFNTKGCTPLCHQTAENLNQRYMSTDTAGSYEELWSWNPGVSGIKGIAATYFISNLPDETNIEDPNFDNKIATQELSGDYGFYRNKAKELFAPAEKIVGDKAPLYIIKDTPASGDAATVKATGKWDRQKWILEISRPRNPENIDLTKFDVGENEWKDYLFSIAIHYNNERDNHKTMLDGATLRMVGKGVQK